MEFKGIIVGVSSPLKCISCGNEAYQFEQMEHCELSFCSPQCQEIFWNDLYWDFEEEECEVKGSNLFELAIKSRQT